MLFIKSRLPSSSSENQRNSHIYSYTAAMQPTCSRTPLVAAEPSSRALMFKHTCRCDDKTKQPDVKKEEERHAFSPKCVQNCRPPLASFKDSTNSRIIYHPSATQPTYSRTPLVAADQVQERSCSNTLTDTRTKQPDAKKGEEGGGGERHTFSPKCGQNCRLPSASSEDSPNSHVVVISGDRRIWRCFPSFAIPLTSSGSTPSTGYKTYGFVEEN